MNYNLRGSKIRNHALDREHFIEELAAETLIPDDLFTKTCEEYNVSEEEAMEWMIADGRFQRHEDHFTTVDYKN